MTFNPSDYRQAALNMIRPAGGSPGSPQPMGGSPQGAQPAATVGTLLADAVKITLATGWTPEVNAAWSQALEALQQALPGQPSPEMAGPQGREPAPLGTVAQASPMTASRPPR